MTDGYEREMASTTGRSTSALPEEHRKAMAPTDGCVVIATRWGRLGANVPNEFVADYVRGYDGSAFGFACVDPQENSATDELERSVAQLGLRGLKLSPVYQGFHPWDRKAWRVYECANSLGIPVMFHQAGAFAANSILEWGDPVLLDKVARSFPNLTIIVAHMGQPWIDVTVQLMRKHPRVFADLSARYYRPWQLTVALLGAIDYGVTDRLLFGSDFPMQTPEEAAEQFRLFARNHERGMPDIPIDVIEDILSNRPFELLGLFEE